MKFNFKERMKQSKGITLIALIITIIVLLILAAISIATLTGENGILTKAGDAKTQTQEAEAKEEVKLSYNAVQTDAVINGYTIDDKAKKLQEELQKRDSSATVTVDGTNLKVNYKGYEIIINENGTVEIAKSKITINQFIISGTKVTTPPLPEGFVHVGGTIDEGYVISDASADENKGVDADLEGNQFVWVPVDKDQKISVDVTSEENISSLVITDPYGDTIETKSNVEKTYKNEQIIPTINGKYRLKITTENGETKEQELDVYSLYAIRMWNIDMYTSDEYAQANGFENALDFVQNGLRVGSIEEAEQSFISEYKEGHYAETEDYTNKVNSNGGFYIGRYEAGDSSATYNRTNATDGTLVTQKNKFVYNMITQIDALNKAKAYNTNLTSSLLTGAAWDRTLGWLYETGAKTKKEITMDSTSWGNYQDDDNTNNPAPTGSNDNYAIKNIYDMAGNVAEYTNETYGTRYSA